METIADNVSFFKSPISNTIPEKTVSLYAVSKYIQMDYLKEITDKVRSGECSKTDTLPYITPSGCFTERNKAKIESYSGVVHIDIDKMCTYKAMPCPSDISSSEPCLYSECKISVMKHILFADKFLNPALIFASPSGRGLKIFIRIRGSEAIFHDDYFRIISDWLKKQYNLDADQSCRDISRACFLCHDPDALFSPFGCVTHDELFRVKPPKATEPPPIVALFKTLYSRFYHTADFTRYRADKLNHCHEVHEHALCSLRKAGWIQNGTRLCRPGKTNSRATSATYSYLHKPKIYSFYPFSDNAHPFTARNWYTDCMVIAILEYKGDYDRCVSELYREYEEVIKDVA